MNDCLCNGQIRKSWVCHEHRESGIAQMMLSAHTAREYAIRLSDGEEFCIGCMVNKPDDSCQAWGCFVCREWVYSNP
jgi:hypothetical protein